VPDTERKSATPEQFLESFPLYSRIKIGSEFPTPNAISRECPECEKETTWNLVRAETLNPSNCFTYLLEYRCQRCRDRVTQCVVFFVRCSWPDDWQKSGGAYAQKVGEFPRASISIAKTLEKELGPTAEYYKRGLISRNSGFGLGALAYLRRVVEEKTNDLIEVVAQLAEAQNEPPTVVAAIQSAREQKTTYDQRIRIASEAMPPSLKPDGANALAVLFDLISAGLHAGSEEICLEIADEIRDVFEHVFSTLRAQVDAQRQMSAKLKKWAGSKTVQEVPPKMGPAPKSGS
jgi:hypothetical protein